MATKPKTTISAGTTMSPMDMVQNPNFNSSLMNKNYFNMLSQLVADRQARGEMPNLMPIGDKTQTRGTQDFIDSREPGKMYTADMVDYIDPATGEKVSKTRGVIPGPNSRFVLANGSYQTPTAPAVTTGSAVQQATPTLEELRAARRIPAPTPPPEARPIAPQMQNYNQMLQQGMRRNQDINQAAQSLVAPAGPSKSFSQVAGGIGRMNRMSKKPRPSNISPSNQKLF